jgi:chorismate mutase
VRAIRGATCLTADDQAEMTEAVAEMLTAIVDRNGLSEQDIVSVLFTSTPDLVCGFPASAARTIGFRDIPLMCAQEISVSGALPRVVRVMVLVETDRSRADVEHVFLRGAQVLREDLNR